MLEIKDMSQGKMVALLAYATGMLLKSLARHEA
jgi:hypothetical protein